MKKWIDASEIATTTVLDEKLYRYDGLMKSKPNFDKSNGARKIYQRKEYVIYQVKNGYVVHNTNKEFEKGHTHVKSFSKAKSFIDLVVRNKLPSRPIAWEIDCLVRIANDAEYIERLKKISKIRRNSSFKVEIYNLKEVDINGIKQKRKINTIQSI